MVIKNNVWIYVRWKKKKNRNEYSLATVYNPQGNTPTLTQADREREGEKKGGGDEWECFNPENKL